MVHPSQYTLSADVCGPLRMPGVDPEGRSKAPKKFRYFLAVTYRFPRLHGIPQVFDPLEEVDLCQEEPDDGLRTGPAPAREEELDLMELFEPSGPVEHEPTSRPHGQAATALFDVEDEEEEEPEEVPADEEEHEEVPADEEEPPPDHGHPERGLGVGILRPQGACRIRTSHVLCAVVG